MAAVSVDFDALESKVSYIYMLECDAVQDGVSLVSVLEVIEQHVVT